MEDVKDNTQDEFVKILQESISFFKKEKNDALINRSRNTQKDNLIDALLKILENKNNGIVHMYRLFEINKIEHAKQFTDAITLFLKRIETEGDDDYSLAKLEIGGALFEDMVNKYNNKYDLTISSTNDVSNSSLFRSNVKKIIDDDIDEYDKGVKLTSKEFQTLFMERRQKYYDNKSTREIMKVLGDALKDKKKIAEKILENTKNFLENKEAADNILQIFKDNIVNKDLEQIEQAFNTAKTNIDAIDGLDNKESYYTSIETIKITGFNLYFERKRKEILQLANNEISKKETIEDIEAVAKLATDELNKLKEKNINIKAIDDANGEIQNFKTIKKEEINDAGIIELNAHIVSEIATISEKIQYNTTDTDVEIIAKATEAINKLEKLEGSNTIPEKIKKKLKEPNAQDDINAKIQAEKNKIITDKQKALSKYILFQNAKISNLAHITFNNQDATIKEIDSAAKIATEAFKKLKEKKIDEDKIDTDIGKIDTSKKEALKKYVQRKIADIKSEVQKFENITTISKLDEVANKARVDLEQLKAIETGVDIEQVITEITDMKEKKKKEIDAQGKNEVISYINSETENILDAFNKSLKSNDQNAETIIGTIVSDAIQKLVTLKILDNLPKEIKEKLIDSTTIPEEINTIIENKIAKIQELENGALIQYANKKIEEEIKNLITTGEGILQGQDKDKKGYEKSKTIYHIKNALETNLNKIIDENFKKTTKSKYEEKLKNLEEKIMKESKDALIINAKAVIEKALDDEKLKATELKKTKDEEIKNTQNKLKELVQESGEKARLQMNLAKSIGEKEEEIKIKKEEIIKAKAEVANAALELKEAQDESSKVDAPIMAEAKAKAEAATASKAEAEAKAEAAAAEQVTNYTLARIAHKDEEDKNKLIKASLNYDEFITDINKRLDNIIFLCNKYDFERINMLLKKLIVNHDYVAKNINQNERKYSDLNSIDELTDKLLKKGEYNGMITYMDKNLNLINVKFDDFLTEYIGKIKQFYEESMSEDIQDINSKIVKILYKLKKLRYGDGKEQDTLPFDFALIADNAIIYKMNSYNFFKKIMKNLHIIQESIPDDANFEEFIAEQRQIFNSKFYRMYEILYRDFQNKLHASLDKIDIIKGRSKNNLSAIIKKLETPVIDDPENIAKAMSYADDLKIPIPDDEVVVPGVKADNIDAILSRVNIAKEELKTKTEEVSRLNGELNIIDANLLKLKDKNTSNEKERDEIEKEKNEIEENIKLNEQSKEDIEDDINIEIILKDKDMALMGIEDTTDKENIKLQKEWIKSMENIEIEDKDKDKDKETFAYIMKAVNNTNAGESPSEQEEKVINRDSSG